MQHTTPRQRKADRVDASTKYIVAAVVLIPAVAWLASLAAGVVVACVLAGLLTVAGIGLEILYVETDFGCDVE